MEGKNGNTKYFNWNIPPKLLLPSAAHQPRQTWSLIVW